MSELFGIFSIDYNILTYISIDYKYSDFIVDVKILRKKSYLVLKEMFLQALLIFTWVSLTEKIKGFSIFELSKNLIGYEDNCM